MGGDRLAQRIVNYSTSKAEIFMSRVSYGFKTMVFIRQKRSLQWYATIEIQLPNERLNALKIIDYYFRGGGRR